MVQQLELLVSVPAAACNLWPQLELSVSAHEANAPNSFSSAGAVGLANYDRWFQRLKPLVSASETDAPSCWSRRSQQARPMLSAAGAVGFDSLGYLRYSKI
ncbi:hypothetical protein PCANC_23101 [Puccinia coronata f. sp. avenae]|uniref:Uncharacterized protein n=1 Tax=Puccinia coronata f. sp. avenae TaxID=200324 RepID=A0A2N5U6S1_9BASI|nr:hypothetical protein PCANC_23101 [Puccinia coronata f. sp. avenae]